MRVSFGLACILAAFAAPTMAATWNCRFEGVCGKAGCSPIDLAVTLNQQADRWDWISESGNLTGRDITAPGQNEVLFAVFPPPNADSAGVVVSLAKSGKAVASIHWLYEPPEAVQYFGRCEAS